MKPTINFRNRIQQALFKCELSGQISDGMWENTRPVDHWKVWCSAEVEANPAKPVGVNFYADRHNYDFSSNRLLSIIGERMVRICNMAENGCELSDINQFNNFNFIEDPAVLNRASEWAQDKQAKLISVFGSKEAYDKAISGTYDLKKLRQELKDMKDIIRIIN